MPSSRFHAPVLAAAITLCVSIGTSPASAQQPSNSVSSRPTITDSATGSQQERALAAMEHSLAAQQSALDTFHDKEPDSVRQQRESIRRQTGTLQGLGDSDQPNPAEQNVAQAHSAPVAFFATPWPSASPLAVPNVQMLDDNCQAMGKEEIEKLVQGAARKQALEPELLRSVMRQESGFKPCAVSTAGAMGLMQIMPDTADMLHLDDPFDPAKNADAGAQFLKMMLNRYQGNVAMALSAYNAGPGKVDKAGGVPPISETMQYVTSILRNLSLVY